MTKIHELFTDDIHRRIEKVISYQATDQLKSEIQEYVVTDTIENNLTKVLDLMDASFQADMTSEVGIWVSGFYGSGKSSLTKYLGFALDPSRTVGGKPFLEAFTEVIPRDSLKARLRTVAKKHSMTVFLVDMAAGAAASSFGREISARLYYEVLHWAGFSREVKVANLELLVRRGSRTDEYRKVRQQYLPAGQSWEQIKDIPMVVGQVASKVAHNMYPNIWQTPDAFANQKIQPVTFGDEQVKEMLAVVREKSGQEKVLFVLDEVGHYVASDPGLIRDLAGLAVNLKNLSKGKALIMATAQQTLTEDSPGAQLNMASLYALKDRFPISVFLEASDIKDITHKRLLRKNGSAEKVLGDLFDSHGSQLRMATQLSGTSFSKSDFGKVSFTAFYPFLPQHFDFLLRLLSQLAKSTGGMGLRSAIKVIQELLTTSGAGSQDDSILGSQPVGSLANTVQFFDILRSDIQKSRGFLTEGVALAQAAFGADSLEVSVAKSVAVLQVLEDFPLSAENLAAMMHPSVTAGSRLPEVRKAIKALIEEKSVPLSEVDGQLRFLSEAVNDLERKKRSYEPMTKDLATLAKEALSEIFSPMPSAKLENTKAFNSGVRLRFQGTTYAVIGDNEDIQLEVDFSLSDGTWTAQVADTLAASRATDRKYTWSLLAKDHSEFSALLLEIYRCRKIYEEEGYKPSEREVKEYLDGQQKNGDRRLEDFGKLLVKSLESGVFVFRGVEEAVKVVKPELGLAVRQYLAIVAGQVYPKFGLASFQADGSLAERFMKAENLAKVDLKDDPMGLVKKVGGSYQVDLTNPALKELKAWFDKNGHSYGKDLLAEFSNPVYGWQKDTTRYLVAALFAASEIEIRYNSDLYITRSSETVEAVKSAKFNTTGFGLRGGRPTPEQIQAAAKQLEALTGSEVLFLEDHVNQSVIRHFPDYQKDLASLPTQLQMLHLPGADRANDLLSSLAEILKGGAAEAVPQLSKTPCQLADSLVWARAVTKFLADGGKELVQEAQRLKDNLDSLPPGVREWDELRLAARDQVEALGEVLTKQSFHDDKVKLQQLIATVKSLVATSVEKRQKALEAQQEADWKQVTSSSAWKDCAPDVKQDVMDRFRKAVPVVTGTLADVNALNSWGISAGSLLNQAKAEVTKEADKKPNKSYVRQPWPRRFTKSQIDGLITDLTQLKQTLADDQEVELDMTDGL